MPDEPNFDEYYMVHDRIWFSVATKREVLDSVEVYLKYNVTSGLGSWSGRIRNAPVTADWSEVRSIRLSEGGEAEVSVHKVQESAGGGLTRRSAQILGKGAPPFDIEGDEE